MKNCLKCRTNKALSEYHSNKSMKDGHNPYCKDCWNAMERERKSRNTEHHKRLGRETMRRRRARDPIACRDYRLQFKYRIGNAEYERMFVAQNGLCAICGKVESKMHGEKRRDLSVDHCHTTGRIRGLLCHSCNRGIGLLKDDPKLLTAMRVYRVFTSQFSRFKWSTTPSEKHRILNYFLKEQEGLCAICWLPESNPLRGKIRQLSLDHDHSTNEVRGLLCNKCNRAFGILGECEKVLETAQKYLQ